MGLFDERRISQNELERIVWLYENRLESLDIDDRAFIEGVVDRIDQYGLDTFFSAGQLRYLEYVEKRYA
jgi:hypothetical protein